MQDATPLPPLPLTVSVATVIARAFDRLGRGAAAEGGGLADLLHRAIEAPARDEARLVVPARQLGLGPAEILALALLAAVETDPLTGARVLSLQGGRTARPSAGTLADLVRAVLPRGPEARRLLEGPLFALPLARLLPSAEPAVLAPVALSEAMLAALGLPGPLRLAEPAADRLSPPESYRRAAARVLGRIGGRRVALVLRGGLQGDRWLLARALGEAAGRPLADLTGLPDAVAGLGPALTFRAALPAEEARPAPGSRTELRPLDGIAGPRLVLVGSEGGVTAPGWDAVDLPLPALTTAERRAIWAGAGGPEAPDLPRAGLGPARLAAVAARLALAEDAGDPAEAQRRAAADEARPDLEPQGRPVAAHVDDAALVAPPALRRELDLLAQRCLQRRRARAGLGPAFRAQPPSVGVRALFAGPSGSGKTLAASWLATRLGMALFRVDLSTIVSKYIGETEENLARILDRAEAADVILLFDEADSLFGARTEVKDSTDRFANNQTNYLLSRIETHDGIVLMTTNGRQRIDAAFSRRIEQVIEVPIPDPAARRAIWCAHLGAGHGLSGADLNLLAAGADIAGGHIRAITLTAAVMAEAAGRPIGIEDVRQALASEYRKIGRTPPASLVRG